MALPPPTRPYIGIPPPPLPEFRYRSRVASIESSAGMRADNFPQIFDGTREKSHHHKLSAYSEAVKSEQPRDEVPASAVYHVCRICLCPRSARYHQEHPIPVDGVPPPSGICRRCRVVSVDDTKSVAEIVQHTESKDVKLGVKCLVPDADCLTNEEMPTKRAGHLVSQIARVESEYALPPVPRYVNKPQRKQSEEIVYRHIHVTVPPAPMIQRSSARLTSSESRILNEQSVNRDEGYIGQHSSRPRKPNGEATVDVCIPVVPPPLSPPFAAAAALRKIEAAEISTAGSVMPSIRSRRTSIRRVSETERSALEVNEPKIRRLARDEIVRYRQAERKIEAHKEPYAHGRLIPVEQEYVPVARRIELQADVTEKMPWQLDAIESRRDSAFALPVLNTKETEQTGTEAPAWTLRTERVPERPGKHRFQAPSSSCSSDTTRWPGAEMKRSYRVTEDKMSLDDETARDYRVNGASNARYTSADARSKLGSSQVMDVVKDREPPGGWRPHEETQYYKVTRRTVDAPEDVSKRKDNVCLRHRAYGGMSGANDPLASARPCEKVNAQAGDHERSSRATDRVSTEESKAFLVTRLGEQVVGREVKRAQDAGCGDTLVMERIYQKDLEPIGLPYPHEASATPVSMPSPSSHASRLAKSSKSREHDREYVYVERTVEPLGKPGGQFSEAQRNHDYYRETSEYLHRGRTLQDRSEASQRQPTRPEVKQRRPSDVSSRVRFAKKLDISPTPPGSDASSAQFRSFGGKYKATLDGQGPPEHGGNLIAEYEHRGRQRSRTPSGAHGFYYERDVVHSHERGYRPMHEDDPERTPKPALAKRRTCAPSDTATGLSTLPSNIRPIARALSESPSREILRAAAMRHRSDGLLPYVEPTSPAASLMAEDGSTSTSDSINSYRREVDARHQSGGRRLKR